MSRKIVSFEKLNGKNMKIGVVKSRWNSTIVDSLMVGALRALTECNVPKKNMVFLEVPGSFELPFGAYQIIKESKVDVVLILGCTIKGETPHDEYINAAVSQGVMDLGLNTGVPVIFGLLTCLNEKQAMARSSGDNNYGYFWAKTAVEMGLLKKKKI